MSYSQHDEDGYIYRLINDHKLKITPFFADFGSCDGIHLNNCRLFSEHGWGGLFVEANPDYFAKLHVNYQHRPDITTINAAVSDHSGFEFFTIYPDHLDHSGIHLIPKFENHKNVQVALIQASTILPDNVGILSLDVEGLEQTVLADIFTAGIYPEILIVESNTPDARWEQMEIIGTRYHLLNVLDVNTIWIRRDKWIQP